MNAKVASLVALVVIALLGACSGSSGGSPGGGGSCGGATCSPDELCCNIADATGACSPYCVRGASCPSATCQDHCNCPGGEICCDVPGASGMCAQECTSASTCPAVVCTVPPPPFDGGTGTDASGDSSCPDGGADACGLPCSTPGATCIPTGGIFMSCEAQANGFTPTWVCAYGGLVGGDASVGQGTTTTH